MRNNNCNNAQKLKSRSNDIFSSDKSDTEKLENTRIGTAVHKKMLPVMTVLRKNIVSHLENIQAIEATTQLLVTVDQP